MFAADIVDASPRPMAGPPSGGHGRWAGLWLAALLLWPGRAAAQEVFDFVPPAFDVLRIEAAGSAIIIGTAGPGVVIDLVLGATIVARAQANARGEWVLRPGQALPVGTHVLALRVTTADGRFQVVADRRITLVVSEIAGRLVATLADEAKPTEPVAAEAVTIEAVVEGGRIVAFAGTATAGSAVRLAIGGEPFGDGAVAADGTWRIGVATALPAGVHHIRATAVRATRDIVLAEAELTFVLAIAEAAATAAPSVRTATVGRGESLWDLAVRYYGAGERYLEIFAANRAQIRRADVIFPGQVLVIP